jgi:hypothetical protein
MPLVEIVISVMTRIWIDKLIAIPLYISSCRAESSEMTGGFASCSASTFSRTGGLHGK